MGAWSGWYRGLSKPEPYGDTRSYEIAAEFLADCATVEDWGSGKGFFRTLRPDVLNVDGTRSPLVDIVTDLRCRHSRADGILLRHVLEHNYDWQAILDNAAASAHRKLCVVLFTPCAPRTHQIAFTDDLGVPDLSFALGDLLVRLVHFDTKTERIESATQYGEETIIRCLRSV